MGDCHDVRPVRATYVKKNNLIRAKACLIHRFLLGTTLASLYCNRATREAFQFLFQEFFDAILHVTKKPLEIAAFHEGAHLLNFIFDGEAAQMQGCGDVMLTWNDPASSGITMKDPLQLVQYVAKTCVQHFYRCVDTS